MNIARTSATYISFQVVRLWIGKLLDRYSAVDNLSTFFSNMGSPAFQEESTNAGFYSLGGNPPVLPSESNPPVCPSRAILMFEHNPHVCPLGGNPQVCTLRESSGLPPEEGGRRIVRCSQGWGSSYADWAAPWIPSSACVACPYGA